MKLTVVQYSGWVRKLQQSLLALKFIGRNSGTAVCRAVVHKAWDRCIAFQPYKYDSSAPQGAERLKV